MDHSLNHHRIQIPYVVGSAFQHNEPSFRDLECEATDLRPASVEGKGPARDSRPKSGFGVQRKAGYKLCRF